MYQPTVNNMGDPNMVNGLPQKLDNSKVNFFPQDKQHHPLNGVHSEHSSRSSSPSIRLGQIPSSQLPPNKFIPQSQLPPSRSPITTITQKVSGLSVNRGMPKNPTFSTSTPNLQSPVNFGHNSAFSPIAPTVPRDGTQGLENVLLRNINGSGSENVKADTNVIAHTTTNSQQTNSQINATQQFHSNVLPQHQRPTDQNENIFQQSPAVPLQLNSNQAFSSQQTTQRPIGVVQQRSTPQSQLPPMAALFPNQQRLPIQTPKVPPVSISQSFPAGPLTIASNPALPQTSNLNVQPVSAHINTMQNGPSSMQSPFHPNSPPPNLYPSQMNQSNGQTTPQKTNLHSNRYPASSGVPPLPQQNQMNFQQPFQQQQYQNRTPQQQYPTQPQTTYPLQPPNAYGQPQNTYNAQQAYQNQPQGVTQAGFNKYWGTESYDLLQIPNILPTSKIEAPRISLGQELLDQANCSPDIFRCTMTKIPENKSLLQKSRLPLGVLIHPFRDLSHLPVIQCNVIVRCRACRTYINPFVLFVDSKRWKCNLCYRINELPEEFQYDPVSKTYGDPSRRPEIKSSTIEYIAPAEYMLRPPQPAVYLYLLDVSRLAVESGYLHTVCHILLEELKNLPGDARTQIGFVAYDSALHFYSFAEGLSQPHEMTILEIDDVFLPTPDNLLVNLKDRMELVADLLSQLPTRYNNSFDNNSALGAALQVAHKMMNATGGRVTVFQASLPNIGPGALSAREDPSQRSTVEVSHLKPANDFYKRLALECSGQQIAVDLFIVNSTYVDIATISGISKFSGGCIHHFPLFKNTKPLQKESLDRCFRRYLIRKIGFEAVMRIRCTRGLSIHTFHGNFFVRSTDLLSLPNINPDAGFGMQVAIEENLSDVQTICFQAALLYTSSKGERRIRVHTMCLPVTSTLHDIIHSADQQCIVGLLSKMAVDRSVESSLSDAREAFINVAIDILSSYKLSLNMSSPASGLLAPNCLRVLPLYISALLKLTAFRTGTTTRLDDRVKAMIDMKTKPLYQLIQMIYPDLYPVHELERQEVILNAEEDQVPMPPRLQLTARCLENKGAFLMDMGEHLIILVCPNVSQDFLTESLGVPSYEAISDQMYEIPLLDNLCNQRLHQFINYLNEDKPFAATIQVIRDNSPHRVMFLERLVEDRVENALSYHEFLQHLKAQVK